MPYILALFIVFLMAACDDPEGTQKDASTDVDTDSDSDSDSDTDTDRDAPVECEDIPDAPVSVTVLEGPRGFHGLAFDSDGYIYGTDFEHMYRAKYDDETPSIFLSGQNEGNAMVSLPGGDFLFVDGLGVMRISSTGDTQYLGDVASGAYGIALGTDGMAYVAHTGGIHRLDPDTGQKEFVVDVSAIENFSARVVDFSPDGTRMYIGASSLEGELYYVDLDQNLNPIGEPVLLAKNISEGAGWHDGMAVDRCGNIYIAEFYAQAVYKVTPSGEASIYLDWGEYGGTENYGHGMVWGTGQHSWRADALYMPQYVNDFKVVEVVLGVTK